MVVRWARVAPVLFLMALLCSLLMGDSAWADSPLTWSGPEGVDSDILYGVSCATASMCVAVDAGGNVLSTTNPTGGASAWSAPANISGFYILDAVSCPTTTFCATGDDHAHAWTSTNPTGGAGAWTSAPMQSGPVAISCP